MVNLYDWKIQLKLVEQQHMYVLWYKGDCTVHSCQGKAIYGKLYTPQKQHTTLTLTTWPLAITFILKVYTFLENGDFLHIDWAEAQMSSLLAF